MREEGEEDSRDQSPSQPAIHRVRVKARYTEAIKRKAQRQKVVGMI